MHFSCQYCIWTAQSWFAHSFNLLSDNKIICRKNKKASKIFKYTTMKIINISIPLYLKLRSVDSLLSITNYTLSINFTIEKRNPIFRFCGLFSTKYQFIGFEILQQAAQLKMELIWENWICEVIQDLRCLKFCDNLAKIFGKLWL